MPHRVPAEGKEVVTCDAQIPIHHWVTATSRGINSKLFQLAQCVGRAALAVKTKPSGRELQVVAESNLQGEVSAKRTRVGHKKRLLQHPISRAALFNRDTMHATCVVLNFLIATLKKVKTNEQKNPPPKQVNFNGIFLRQHIQNVISSPCNQYF